jgi:hypothetical protein
MDDRWTRAVRAAFEAGTVARLVFATGTPPRRLHSQGLISSEELEEYLHLPAEDRAVWEQSDLLERQRLYLIDGGSLE